MVSGGTLATCGNLATDSISDAHQTRGDGATRADGLTPTEKTGIRLTPLIECDIMDDMKHDLEQTLKDAARRSGLSMNALGKATGLPYQTVHGFVTGDRQIAIRSVAKLADVLGLELVPCKRRKGG